MILCFNPLSLPTALGNTSATHVLIYSAPHTTGYAILNGATGRSDGPRARAGVAEYRHPTKLLILSTARSQVVAILSGYGLLCRQIHLKSQCMGAAQRHRVCPLIRNSPYFARKGSRDVMFLGYRVRPRLTCRETWDRPHRRRDGSVKVAHSALPTARRGIRRAQVYKERRLRW